VWDTSGVLPAIRSQSWFVLTRKSFLLRGFLLFLLHFGITSALGEETIWLSWNTPDPSEGVIAYQVYYGTSSHNYTSSDISYYPNGDLIPGLILGQTYYFAVAAVNTNGTVSALSQEISYTVPVLPPPVIQYTVDRDENGNPLILEMTANWSLTADWELDYSFDLQNWYMWQAGTGTACGANADFSLFGSQAYYRVILY
jgi:hypothetical protein